MGEMVKKIGMKLFDENSMSVFPICQVFLHKNEVKTVTYDVMKKFENFLDFFIDWGYNEIVRCACSLTFEWRLK